MGEDCPKKATHRVMWATAGIKLDLCAEHLNGFVVDKLEISTDLEKEWRKDPMQLELDAKTQEIKQALVALDSRKAAELLGEAFCILTQAQIADKKLDEAELEKVQSRLATLGELELK
jgi:hypothetical protein